MTVISGGLSPYAQFGSAYARAAATQPSLADALAASESGGSSDPNAATNLTLSEAARARLAGAAAKDFSTVATEARAALDGLYAAAKVKGPVAEDGGATIDLSSIDRRALFAIAINRGGKFSPDEQKVANAELAKRFDAALAPGAATLKLTGDYSSIYKAALDFLEAASPEEKATGTWRAQHAAVLKGVEASGQNAATAPPAVAGDPVQAYLLQNPDGRPTSALDFSSVARRARAALDAQSKAATAAGKELVFDAGRKSGQQADLAAIDNRSLAAMSLNQDGLFSNLESYAAKHELASRNRASILAALKQSQSSGDPTRLSLGILNAYSSMSAEERQAANWTPAFRDHAIANYKSASHILAMLRSA